MNLKTGIISLSLIILFILQCSAQNNVNKTDNKGLKQGRWIRKYPNNAIMYDGVFKDDHPVGEFKRFYEDNTLKSILDFKEGGNEADATLYYPNGYIASRGKYINQMKEGKWQFFSQETEGYLVSEEYYSGNLRDGLSLKFYPDSTVAEKVNYFKGVKNGEWIQYFQNGNTWLKSYYVNGKLNGNFEVWFENGSIQVSGNYKNNSRDGIWQIFKQDGTLRYKLKYNNGVTNDRQMEIDQSDYLDSLEMNPLNVPDPEKSGNMW